MGEILPLFPLGNVLFPEMLMPLHIFEPRYRLLVRRSMDRDAPFGIVLIKTGDGSPWEEHGSPGEDRGSPWEEQRTGPGAIPHRVGTLARIVAHAPLPDGRSLITVRGDRRFEILNVMPDEEPYLLGLVRYLDDEPEEPARRLADLVGEAYADYLVGVLAATGGVRREVPIVEEICSGSPCDVSFRVAAGLAVEDDERQTLLAATSARERLVREREILSRESALLAEMLVRMRARGEGPTLH